MVKFVRCIFNCERFKLRPPSVCDYVPVLCRGAMDCVYVRIPGNVGRRERKRGGVVVGSTHCTSATSDWVIGRVARTGHLSLIEGWVLAGPAGDLWSPARELCAVDGYAFGKLRVGNGNRLQ
jgi:hypothetical protein